MCAYNGSASGTYTSIRSSSASGTTRHLPLKGKAKSSSFPLSFQERGRVWGGAPRKKDSKMSNKAVWKGTAITAPVPPVMVTCGEPGKANIITVAWTGTVNTKPPMTYISVRPTRYSYGIIKTGGEFVVNLTTAALVKKADYCGIYTGAKVDKFRKCGLTEGQASAVNVTLIAESPFNIECRVTQVIPLGSHDMFLAEIVAVDIDGELIDSSGKLHLERAGLAAFAHGDYYALGKKLAPFGCSVKAKNKTKKAHCH